MSNEIEIEYNTSLKPLEEILNNVCQPGEFFIEGSWELPMPAIEIDGVGVISFPIPEFQVKEMIRAAALAPYGRGEETIYDSSVRKTWQISPSHIQISGKSWPKNFSYILEEIKAGLGCPDVTVCAELYKLLIYDEGGFFLPHRDSEKEPGMFGTMIMALPSSHEGGQLIVRHMGREVTIDLSGAENSELKFGAFYADCEHEVRPVTKGYRICLVYNLIQKPTAKNQGESDSTTALTAPCYINETEQVANILKTGFNEIDQPSKLIWLLEHQYTTAELSFDRLKNRDAAIAKVLTKAAEQAKCALHLGIVHIEESGGADADFGYYSSRSRRGYYRYDEMEVSSEDYEVIDVDGSEKYIDSWLDIQNRRMNFGKIPIETGELLPANALDDEEPDEQRLLEATGNAGVSFERAYHRAAFILWPQKKYINVLLQAGLANSVTYFNEQLNLALAQPKSSNWPTDINYIALAIIEEFENLDESKYFYSDLSITSAKMLTLLCQFEKASLVERFIHVIINAYDGSENEALVQAANFLKEPMLVDKLFATLFQKNMSQRPVECINLFKKLTSIYSQNTKTVKDILEKSSQEIINGLNLLNEKNLDLHYWRSKKPAKIDSEAVVTLWTALEELNINQLQDQLTSILIADCHIFNPRSVLVPALAKHRFAITLGSPLQDLLEHAGKYLLTKSEFPPSSPTNWAQEDDVKCSCEDCKDLKNFLKDPKSQVFRFQMVQSGRDHIAGQISRHGLDMTTSTDKSRRPYTLICTKTRKRYQEKCDDYQADVKAMQLLIPIVANLIGSNSSGKRNSSIFNLQNKLKEAVDRQIEPTDHPPKKKHKILLSL